MGLSATQAKLLFITSRQTDVSAKMQRISNQTMILARDEEDISTKYSQMLNATQYKAVDGVDLSYNTLMHPTEDAAKIGDYKLITSGATDAVVLSTSYANALGLNEYGDKDAFNSKYPDFNSFAAKMIPALGGVFTEPPEHPTEYEVTPAKADALNNWNTSVKNFISQNGDFPKPMTMNDILAKVPGKWSDYIDVACGARMAHQGYGNNFTNNIGNLSFSQIANTNDDYITILAQDGGKVSGVPTAAAQQNFKNIGNVIAIGIGRGLGVDVSANSSYMQTMTSYINSLASTINFSDLSKNRDTNTAYQSGVNDAKNVLVGNATETYRRGNDNDFFTLNVSEFVRRLCLKAMSLYNSDYNPGSNVRDPNTFSHDVKNNAYTIEVNEKGISKNDYYNKLKTTYDSFSGKSYIGYEEAVNLANQYKGEMPLQSAVEKPQTPITDAERQAHLNDEIKNSPFLSFVKTMYNKMSSSGYIVDSDLSSSSLTNKFATGAYKLADADISKNSDYFAPVADTEIREKAKGWYDAEIAKINRKEKILNMDMQKLQTEYDSLTNDLNSVQAIIQSNVSKSFTFFQG